METSASWAIRSVVIAEASGPSSRSRAASRTAFRRRSLLRARRPGEAVAACFDTSLSLEEALTIFRNTPPPGTAITRHVIAFCPLRAEDGVHGNVRSRHPERREDGSAHRGIPRADRQHA